ncbi:MAG: hypothetical protein M5U28_24635 [Sandaracinaceae bacterium]|nr:hypothetical protein [Sandaracinaceae bacterium]
MTDRDAVHHRVCALKGQRGGLDYEQGRWLLAAHRLRPARGPRPRQLCRVRRGATAASTRAKRASGCAWPRRSRSCRTSRRR